ncbi:MAG: hypothetical protein ACR2LI_08935, partial [Propionibacteriaceae bacterium]
DPSSRRGDLHMSIHLRHTAEHTEPVESGGQARGLIRLGTMRLSAACGRIGDEWYGASVDAVHGLSALTASGAWTL